MEQLQAQLNQSQQQVRDLAAQIDKLRSDTDYSFLKLRAEGVSAAVSAMPEEREIQLFDLKTLQPSVYNGRRGELWKQWAKRIKAFCNARKSGF